MELDDLLDDAFDGDAAGANAAAADCFPREEEEAGDFVVGDG